MEYKGSHNASHNSFALKILTSKLFDIKILQTVFADPAPSKASRGMGGGGVPQAIDDFPDLQPAFPLHITELFQAKIHRLSRPEAHRDQLRHTGLLHGYAVEYRRNAHRLLAVGDQHELGLDAHLLHQFGEAADVRLVEWRVHFIEDAERAGRVLEDADQQGECSERLLASGEQQHTLQALAGRRRDYVDSALGRIILVGELHEGVAAAEELLESLSKVLVDLGESFLELLARDFVDLANRGCRVLDRRDQVLALRVEEGVALGGLAILFKRHHVHRSHGFEFGAHLTIRLIAGSKFIAGDEC